MKNAVTTGGRTTMIDPTTRRRLVDLSVIASSALALGGGFLVAAEVDRSRAAPAAITAVLAEPASTIPGSAPIAGLEPAPRPARRVVVVRRSRAS